MELQRCDRLNEGETDLWRQVAAVAGGELVEGLGGDVAAPEWLGGDDVVQGIEGLFHWGTDGGRLIAHLQTIILVSQVSLTGSLWKCM